VETLRTSNIPHSHTRKVVGPTEIIPTLGTWIASWISRSYHVIEKVVFFSDLAAGSVRDNSLVHGCYVAGARILYNTHRRLANIRMNVCVPILFLERDSHTKRTLQDVYPSVYRTWPMTSRIKGIMRRVKH
jgi:hypothetical protein